MQAFILKVLEVVKDNTNNWKQLIISVIIVCFVSLIFDVGKKYIDIKFEQMEQTTTKVVEQTIVENNNQYSEQVMNAIERYPEINIKIDELLIEMNDTYGFNRSAILMYHDGTKSPTGAPFLKYSMRYEMPREDRVKVKLEKENTKDIGYEYISYFAYIVNNQGFFVCNNLEELTTISQVYKSAYEMNGIKSFAFITLTNSEDRPWGILQVFHYDSLHKFTDEEIYALTLKAQKISELLSLLYEN